MSEAPRKRRRVAVQEGPDPAPEPGRDPAPDQGPVGPRDLLAGGGPNAVHVSEDSLLLKLDGFEGPLDLLLDLARTQKLDLANISILALVDQYLAVIEGARRVRLELAAEWLVMAAWLAWLKSRLLVPPAPEDPDDPEQLAAQLTGRLEALALIRAAAGWLGARPALGHDVFGLGAREDHTVVDRSRLVIDQAAFMAAYLRGMRRGTKRTQYQPRKLTWFTVRDALRRLASLVGTMPDWTSLDRFLPEILGSGLERRAAVASLLIAGLEMAKSGTVALRQEAAFGPILLGQPPFALTSGQAEP